MTGQVDEGTVIDYALRLTFAYHGSLHPIVKHLAWSAANGFEGSDMATQDSRQVLMHHEACPNQPAVPQLHGEQPDDPRRHRYVREDDMELGEIDLSVFPRWRLETDFKPLARGWTYVTKKVCYGCVAAGITALSQFPEQATASQAGIGIHPLA